MRADCFLVAQQIRSFSPDPGYAPEDPKEFFANETRQKWLDLVPSKHLLLLPRICEQYADLRFCRGLGIRRGRHGVRVR